MSSSKSLFAALLLAAACSTSNVPGSSGGDLPGTQTGQQQVPDAPPDTDSIAGGQSGTEQVGAYSCDIEAPRVEALAPEKLEMLVGWLPERASYECPMLGGDVVVEIERGTSGRTLIGKSWSDTDRSAPAMECSVYEVDASVRVQLGSAPSLEASALRFDHLGLSAQISGALLGTFQGLEQHVSFTLYDRGKTLFVVSSESSSEPGWVWEHCRLLSRVPE